MSEFKKVQFTEDNVSNYCDKCKEINVISCLWCNTYFEDPRLTLEMKKEIVRQQGEK